MAFSATIWNPQLQRALEEGAQQIVERLPDGIHSVREVPPGHYAAAEEFGIGRASLCRYLVELEACGLVEKKQGFQGNFNTYHLPDPSLILRLY